jgi:hypothetical protein
MTYMTNLNTSNVTLNERKLVIISYGDNNLNTSHVSVNSISKKTTQKVYA